MAIFSGGVGKIWKFQRASGVNFGDQFGKIQRGWDSYGKSLPWGWNGYFLEPQFIKTHHVVFWCSPCKHQHCKYSEDNF